MQQHTANTSDWKRRKAAEGVRSIKAVGIKQGKRQGECKSAVTERSMLDGNLIHRMDRLIKLGVILRVRDVIMYFSHSVEMTKTSYIIKKIGI